jgi:hypothetical protein
VWLSWFLVASGVACSLFDHLHRDVLPFEEIELVERRAVGADVQRRRRGPCDADVAGLLLAAFPPARRAMAALASALAGCAIAARRNSADAYRPPAAVAK